MEILILNFTYFSYHIFIKYLKQIFWPKNFFFVVLEVKPSSCTCEANTLPLGHLINASGQEDFLTKKCGLKYKNIQCIYI
jgi:hypothetical protein